MYYGFNRKSATCISSTFTHPPVSPHTRTYRPCSSLSAADSPPFSMVPVGQIMHTRNPNPQIRFAMVSFTFPLTHSIGRVLDSSRKLDSPSYMHGKPISAPKCHVLLENVSIGNLPNRWISSWFLPTSFRPVKWLMFWSAATNEAHF